MENQDKVIVRASLARSGIGVFGGITVAILAILALAGIHPKLLSEIAAIIAGLTLFFEGGAVLAELDRVLSLTNVAHERRGFVGGLSAEMLAGAAAAVLGILALFGIIGGGLVSIAVIVLGVGLLMGAGVLAELHALKLRDGAIVAGHGRIGLTASSQALVGLAAIVLGILSVIHIHQWTLAIIGLLVIGISTLLSETTVCHKMLSKFK